MLTQLNPPIPVKTPKGKAWAVALIDYGPHWDLQWVTFVHDTGECWTFRNKDIRQEANYTFGLDNPTPFHCPSLQYEEEIAESLKKHKTNGYCSTNTHKEN